MLLSDPYTVYVYARMNESPPPPHPILKKMNFLYTFYTVARFDSAIKYLVSLIASFHEVLVRSASQKSPKVDYLAKKTQ